jgi:hypothetical protein
LVLSLDRPVNQKWIHALHNMGHFSNVMGCPPEAFQFRDCEARVPCQSRSAQPVINHFKTWLPPSDSEAQTQFGKPNPFAGILSSEQLKRERTAEEERLR